MLMKKITIIHYGPIEWQYKPLVLADLSRGQITFTCDSKVWVL